MAGIACQIGLQGMEQSRKAFALKITLRKTPALWAGLLLFPVLCSAQSAFDGTWADGHDQPLQGNPYYDTINIAVIDDHAITKTGKKDGKVTLDGRVTVSADGATKTEVQTQIGSTPFPMEITIKSARVGAGKPGSHAVSGGWQTTEVDVSNHAEDTTFKVSGGALSMVDRMGRSFTAKFDGAHGHIQEQDGHKVK